MNEEKRAAIHERLRKSIDKVIDVVVGDERRGEEVIEKHYAVRLAAVAYAQARVLVGTTYDPMGEKAEEAMREFLRVFEDYELTIAPWLTAQRCRACGALATKYRDGQLLFVGPACDACFALPKTDWWKKCNDRPAP